MKISTLRNKVNGRKIPIWTIIFWLVVWHLASLMIGHDILLVSPVTVIKCLGVLIFQTEFWKSIMFSLIRIAGGFLSAVLLGVFFSALSHTFKFIDELISLPVAVIKSTPVASFIILALIWIPSRNLSVFISFLIVFPVIYTNVLTGIEKMDYKLIEMAKVFDMSFMKKFRYIYILQVMPYFRAACGVSLGMCWKAGIAAEIIGIPKGSIGEHLYNAKVYLNTPELFAWTVVIIFVSILFEKLFLFAIDMVNKMI